ncbi:uncharacterized protein LOC119684888 [Teleopsis dalmanni]|uniref:uncharacterized protein LOC119684888 n=1 Tax=Teleopsis dalmanni TaxID=139649 RepID=UPI0018CE617B|nr:uncharacterized protein LOC119684888 [Teleopsis dalmanni]
MSIKNLYNIAWAMTSPHIQDNISANLQDMQNKIEALKRESNKNKNFAEVTIPRNQSDNPQFDVEKTALMASATVEVSEQPGSFSPNMGLSKSNRGMNRNFGQ